MKDYKKILEGVVDIIHTTEKSDIGFTNICAYIGKNFPELKESEDERIRKELSNFIKEKIENSCSPTPSKNTLFNWIDWLEKLAPKPQGKSALEAIKEEKVDNANKVEPKDYSSIDYSFFLDY